MTWLFIATSEDPSEPVAPVSCASEAAVLQAVKSAVFGGTDGLSAEHEAEAAAIAEELIEDGSFYFEGDPPLHLYRVA
jgi:hypothetical protein